jgi:hypothetical protein
VNIFQNPKLKQEYAIETDNRFEILANMMMKMILTKLLMKSGKALKQ